MDIGVVCTAVIVNKGAVDRMYQHLFAALLSVLLEIRAEVGLLGHLVGPFVMC